MDRSSMYSRDEHGHAPTPACRRGAILAGVLVIAASVGAALAASPPATPVPARAGDTSGPTGPGLMGVPTPGSIALLALAGLTLALRSRRSAEPR